MIRVILCTDEALFAAGVTHVLSSGSAFDLCKVCGSINSLFACVPKLHPQIVMLDWNPTVTLRDLVDVRTLAPWARVVLWARSIPTELAFQAIDQGVHGILDKRAPAGALLKCLEIVTDGGLWFDENLKREILCVPAVQLTLRESQLVTLLCHGMNNKEVAAELGLTEGTIKVYLSLLFQKLGVNDRFELALYGLKNYVEKGGAADFVQRSNSSKRPVRDERRPWLRSLMVGPRQSRVAAEAN